MLLSKTGTYALRAALHLAEHGQAGSVPVNELARALDVPRNYLSKILHQLARGGVLVSERGPRGGFRLAPGARDRSLADILEPVDPASAPRCLLGRPECTDTDPCPVHDRWQQLAQDIERLLRDTTLAELVRQTDPRGA